MHECPSRSRGSGGGGGRKKRLPKDSEMGVGTLQPPPKPPPFFIIIVVVIVIVMVSLLPTVFPYRGIDDPDPEDL